MDDRTPAGVTLPELLVTLAVVGIVAGVAAPAMLHTVQAARLRGAAEAVAGDLRLARELALRTGTRHSVSFAGDPSTGWCCVVSTAADTSCAAARTGQVQATFSSDFPNVRLVQARFAGSSAATFDSPRGTARAGRVTLGNEHGQVSVVVSALGRTRLCSDDDARYPPC